MSRRRVDSPAPVRPPVRSLADKVAWIMRHSKVHTAALTLFADHSITAINAFEARKLKRPKR